jgi:hypothetical protein
MPEPWKTGIAGLPVQDRVSRHDLVPIQGLRIVHDVIELLDRSGRQFPSEPHVLPPPSGLLKGRLKVLDDLCGDLLRGWQVAAVPQAFVLEPKNVEVELVAFCEVFV